MKQATGNMPSGEDIKQERHQQMKNWKAWCADYERIVKSRKVFSGREESTHEEEFCGSKGPVRRYWTQYRARADAEEN